MYDFARYPARQGHADLPYDQRPYQAPGLQGKAGPVDVQCPGSLPPGYPDDYPRTVKLRDGRHVLIRPILPSDAPELGHANKTADADTLRRRFLGGPPRVTPALLSHLTEIDYRQRFALVAIDPATGTGVAIARYEQTGDDVAEIAIVVKPCWRRAGLATELVSLLAEAALARDIRAFTASYLAENRPVAALIKDAGGLRSQAIKQGIAEFSVALERDRAASQTASQPGR